MTDTLPVAAEMMDDELNAALTCAVFGLQPMDIVPEGRGSGVDYTARSRRAEPYCSSLDALRRDVWPRIVGDKVRQHAWWDYFADHLDHSAAEHREACCLDTMTTRVRAHAQAAAVALGVAR